MQAQAVQSCSPPQLGRSQTSPHPSGLPLFANPFWPPPAYPPPFGPPPAFSYFFGPFFAFPPPYGYPPAFLPLYGPPPAFPYLSGPPFALPLPYGYYPAFLPLYGPPLWYTAPFVSGGAYANRDRSYGTSSRTIQQDNTLALTGRNSLYKIGKDPAAFVTQQAEQPIVERHTASSLNPPDKSSKSTQRRQEGEAQEHQESVCQAETDDDRRKERRLQLEVGSLASDDSSNGKGLQEINEPEEEEWSVVQTGISHLKKPCYPTNSNDMTSELKDAAVVQKDDDDRGYKWRRLGAGGRTPPSVQPTLPSSERLRNNPSVEQIVKKFREKQSLLIPSRFRNENETEDHAGLALRDRQSAEGDEGRKHLKRQLHQVTDRFSEAASKCHKTEKDRANVKVEIALPAPAPEILGTGPDGAVTHADILRAQTIALILERGGKLTGKTGHAGQDDSGAVRRRLEEETSRVKIEKEDIEANDLGCEHACQDFFPSQRRRLSSKSSTGGHEG